MMDTDKRDLILIVDDDEINRMVLAAILEEDYETVEAENGFQALDIVYRSETRPKAILLDIIMPEMDGFEVLEKLKADPSTAKIPVLIITGETSDETESRGLKMGSADYVPKPFNPDVVKARLDNHIALTRYQNELESLVEAKTAELMRTYEQTLEVLATVVEYRSLESGEHIKRTSMLSEILINKLMTDPQYADYIAKNDVDPKKAYSIVRATALHDIGKISISDNILLKPGPGRLTDEEFEKMKEHTQFGAQIIDEILKTLGDGAGYLTYCREICYFHHERWDGLGYPTKIAGEDIPFSARLLSIVDVYDALVNQRVYKPALTHNEALDIIVESKGKQFDPVLVEAFIAVSPQFEELETKLKD